ncbi:MAG: helix-turn-helix domain-containing protein [Lachnospiraceae bacterium]|nr:helix-turn-helix domain-containing protein [Lachnospiraceae bacterium]
MEFGAKIKTLRNKRGITQEALVKSMGVTPQTVSKWENDITMPDVALLPELSIFFGITIDELFSLTAEKKMERIDNRIYESDLIAETEANQMEETLKEIGKNPEHKAEAYKLIAVLHNHQAEVHRRIAAEYARTAMELEPCNRDIISEYTNACGSYLPDWDCRNHHALIQELQEFVKKHPESRSASMWLLDNLIADGRLKEAATELERFITLDDTFRCTLYRALLAQAKGDKDTELKCYQELEEQYADTEEEWLVQFSLADMDAGAERYEEAIRHYKKALELQPAPKYTDMPESMAHIYEIMNEKQKAVECYQLALRIIKEDHGIIAGEEVERINRCIKKLMEK